MSRLPRLPAHRPTAAQRERYEIEVQRFCEHILELASREDFRVGARGWAYVLEGDRFIDKDEIDAAERLINDSRKNGNLPLDICADDAKRATENLENIQDPPEDRAQQLVHYISVAEKYYTPFSFWDDKDVYLQMMVEKGDLKSLFSKTCAEFCIPIANWGGWADLNVRADFMRRFKEKEAEGKKCVLLGCLDFDPGALNISNFLYANLEEMAEAVGWSPENLKIDRFGLNYRYIIDHELVWIDNLITGNQGKWKGIGLDDDRHPDHFKPYVQEYLKQYGVRKVEANALLKEPARSRELCRQAILKYLPKDSATKYRRALARPRAQLRREIDRLLESQR
jgi:hypothetical protein